MHGSLLNTLNILALLGAYECTKCMPTDGCTAHTQLNVEGWSRRMDKRCIGDAVEAMQEIWEAAPTVCLVFVLNSGRQVAVQTPHPPPTTATPTHSLHSNPSGAPYSPGPPPPLLAPPLSTPSTLLRTPSSILPQTPHLCFAS